VRIFEILEIRYYRSNLFYYVFMYDNNLCKQAIVIIIYTDIIIISYQFRIITNLLAIILDQIVNNYIIINNYLLIEYQLDMICLDF